MTRRLIMQGKCLYYILPVFLNLHTNSVSITRYLKWGMKDIRRSVVTHSEADAILIRQQKCFAIAFTINVIAYYKRSGMLSQQGTVES
jgi:hypothetical protein